MIIVVLLGINLKIIRKSIKKKLKIKKEKSYNSISIILVNLVLLNVIAMVFLLIYRVLQIYLEITADVNRWFEYLYQSCLIIVLSKLIIMTQVFEWILMI